jgi:hypothetical protein
MINNKRKEDLLRTVLRTAPGWFYLRNNVADVVMLKFLHFQDDF